MAIDGITLTAMLCELSACHGSRIDKVGQPDADTLVLSLHGGGLKKARLLINIHHENGRIQLTDAPGENPAQAPAFCMLLRKYLIGARIDRFCQTARDRIVRMELTGRSPMQDEIPLVLLVELTGRHGNLFLLDGDERILDCMRRLGPDENALRLCMPGVRYALLPMQQKPDPLLMDATAAAEITAAGDPVRTLCDRYQGISRATAEALFSGGASAAELLAACSHIRAGTLLPCLTAQSALPFYPFGMTYTPFPTLSAAMDAFYERRDTALRMRRQAAGLRTTLEHARKRIEKRLASCAETLGEQEEMEQWKRYGELLTAYAGRIPRGSALACVENYYEPDLPKLSIPLDPKLSAMDNAQRYFKRYRKGCTARRYAEQQISLLADELQYLEGQLENLGNCETTQELSEIRDELTREAYLKPERGVKKPQREPSKPLRFTAPDGTCIEIGKNNVQNDRLTRNAPPDCIWMHVKDMAGSHVIVYTEDPTRETLAFAAGLAAYYSKARASANVPVDYTRRKYVKKPGGARPGFVIYQNQRTLTADPSDGAKTKGAESCI